MVKSMLREETMKDVSFLEVKKINEKYRTNVKQKEIIYPKETPSENKAFWKAKIIFEDEKYEYIDTVKVDASGPANIYIEDKDIVVIPKKKGTDKKDKTRGP